jgi:hypothetical protein
VHVIGHSVRLQKSGKVRLKSYKSINVEHKVGIQFLESFERAFHRLFGLIKHQVV